MPRLQRKTFSRPDEVRPFGRGRVEIVKLEDVVLGRTVHEPGWRWSEHVKPIAGTELCMDHHMGFILRGTMHVVSEDGTALDLEPGDAFDIPPGHDGWVVGDEACVSVTFVGARSFAQTSEALRERVLATILFVDIVGSTALATRIGDLRWSDVLAQFNELTRFQLDRFRGREVATTGDGFLALFDGAARSVNCASAIRAESQGIGLTVRCGIHTGEVELVPGDVRGVAIHEASRIMALAGADEILVSSTTRELLVGSGIGLESRGRHDLKGLPGRRQLYRLTAAQ